MNFNKWLFTRGYLPIDRIIANYKNDGWADKEIEEFVERIKKNYRYWCTKNGVKPTF